MQHYRILILWAVFGAPLLFFGCGNKDETTTEVDTDEVHVDDFLGEESIEFSQVPILLSSFTTSEINDLETLNEFFLATILNTVKIDGTKPSDYLLPWLDGLQDQAKEGSLEIPFGLDEQDEVYSKFESEVNNEIWTTYASNLNDESPTDKDLNVHGKYMEFLSKLSETDLTVQHYYEALLKGGGLSAGAQSEIIFNSNLLDVSDPAIQLLLAIHFFTLNEQNRYSFE